MDSAKIDNRGRRLGVDRRQFSYDFLVSERRVAKTEEVVSIKG